MRPLCNVQPFLSYASRRCDGYFQHAPTRHITETQRSLLKLNEPSPKEHSYHKSCACEGTRDMLDEVPKTLPCGLRQKREVECSHGDGKSCWTGNVRSDHLIDLPSAVRRQVLVKRPFKDGLMPMGSDNKPTDVIRVQYDPCDLLCVWHTAPNELGRRCLMIRRVRSPGLLLMKGIKGN